MTCASTHEKYEHFIPKHLSERIQNVCTQYLHLMCMHVCDCFLVSFLYIQQSSQCTIKQETINFALSSLGKDNYTLHSFNPFPSPKHKSLEDQGELCLSISISAVFKNNLISPAKFKFKAFGRIYALGDISL